MSFLSSNLSNFTSHYFWSKKNKKTNEAFLYQKIKAMTLVNKKA